MSQKVNICERHVIILGSASTGGVPQVVEKTPATANHPTDEFRDGQKYEFKSAVGDQAIDNDGGHVKEGNMIHTWGGNGWDNQRWISYVDEHHNPPWGYKLQTADAKNESFVMSALNNFQNHRVVLKAFNGEKEQFWHLIKVPGTTNHQIINASTGKALSNYGSGVNLRTINADVNDLHQHWVTYLR